MCGELPRDVRPLTNSHYSVHSASHNHAHQGRGPDINFAARKHPCAYSFKRCETLAWTTLRRAEDPPCRGHRNRDDEYEQGSAGINLCLRMHLCGITCLGEIGDVGEAVAWSRSSRWTFVFSSGNSFTRIRGVERHMRYARQGMNASNVDPS